VFVTGWAGRVDEGFEERERFRTHPVKVLAMPEPSSAFGSTRRIGHAETWRRGGETSNRRIGSLFRLSQVAPPEHQKAHPLDP
jgi:hypothetical protein